MYILEHSWKKTAPPSTLYEYEQQQFKFKKGNVAGIFEVLEINTHHNTVVECWNLPSFYKSYLGHLIF